MQVSLSKERYGTPEAHERFYRNVAERLRGLPGIDAVAATNGPVTYSPFGFYPLTIDGQPLRPKKRKSVFGEFRRTSSERFVFHSSKAVSSETRIGRLSPDSHREPGVRERALPQRESYRPSNPVERVEDLEIIGVVADARERPDGEIQRALYLPIDAGGFFGNLVLLLRSDRDDCRRPHLGARCDRRGGSAGGRVRRGRPRGNPEALRSLATAVWTRGLLVRTPRSGTVGNWPVWRARVLSWLPHARVRNPHRARRGSLRVRWQVLRQGLLLTVSGLVIGLAGGYAAAQALSSLLVGVTPGDLTTFAVAATLLMATAVIACLVPSSRATRVDPVVALRAE
jgi:putative ABC transport system permease protein